MTGSDAPLDPLLGDDLETDPALAAAVLEIEAHVADAGWDQPGHLFALVETARLVAREPSLAAASGLTEPSAAGSLTPVEQNQLPTERALEEMLAEIAWPDEVSGCAAVVERLVLPPTADHQIPTDAAEAEAFARAHPDRQEVRIVAGATRTGATYCALRMRAHDEQQSVVTGADLVPGLLDLLRATLDEADQPARPGRRHDPDREPHQPDDPYGTDEEQAP